jgi:hypothetical protein
VQASKPTFIDQVAQNVDKLLTKKSFNSLYASLMQLDRHLQALGREQHHLQHVRPLVPAIQ